MEPSTSVRPRYFTGKRYKLKIHRNWTNQMDQTTRPTTTTTKRKVSSVQGTYPASISCKRRKLVQAEREEEQIWERIIKWRKCVDISVSKRVSLWTHLYVQTVREAVVDSPRRHAGTSQSSTDSDDACDSQMSDISLDAHIPLQVITM